ncbi:MAG: hypothetical protein ABIH42_05310 [Planctomycetota bacterium]
MALFQERFSSSVETGAQTVTLALAKGTNYKIKAVYAYIPGADDSAYVEAHRTDGSVSAANKIGETSYNAYTSIDEMADVWAATALKLYINTGLASTVICYFTVVYEYY